MSERPEQRLGDSNVLDTLDFEAILRDNAGLARMVSHHTDLKVSTALETAKDDLKDEIIADLDYDDLPSRLIASIEEGVRESMEDDYVSQETHDQEIEDVRESAYTSGFDAGLAEESSEEADVTLRPSERGTRIVASNGNVISAEAVREAYIRLKAGTLERGDSVDRYDIRYMGPDAIRLGCTKVSLAEVEYLALAMGWRTQDVAESTGRTNDYMNGYTAGLLDAKAKASDAAMEAVVQYDKGYAEGKRYMREVMAQTLDRANG